MELKKGKERHHKHVKQTRRHTLGKKDFFLIRVLRKNSKGKRETPKRPKREKTHTKTTKKGKNSHQKNYKAP